MVVMKTLRRTIRKTLRPANGTVWESVPPTLGELRKDALDGDWMPGEQHPWLERLGTGYGLVVGVGGTALLYALAWLLQRPGRAGAALLVAAVLWVTWATA